MHVCIKRNIHGRTEMEIEQLISGWEDTPSHHPMIDATSLIQAGSIPDVEMEEINSPSSMDIANDDTNEVRSNVLVSFSFGSSKCSLLFLKMFYDTGLYLYYLGIALNPKLYYRWFFCV